MTKELLKKILEARTIIMQFYGKELDYYNAPFKMFELQDGQVMQKIGQKMFVSIPELQNDMDVLKEEVKERIQKKDDAEMFLKNGFVCNHPVRYFHDFENFYAKEKCMLCGKDFLADSNKCIRSIHDLYKKEKSPKIAVFLEEYASAGVAGWGEVEYSHAYDEAKVMTLLKNMLEKLPDGSFDLVDEIEKNEFEHCIINKPSFKKFVLFISGTNEMYLDDGTYVKADSIVSHMDLLDCFKELYNVTFQLVCDKKEVLSYGLDAEDYDTLFINSYGSLEELLDILKSLRDIPFSLVIDGTNLKDISFNNNQIIIKPYQLNLPTLFSGAEYLYVKDYLGGKRKIDSYALKNINKDSLKLIRKKMN